jgi:multiple sugar transport system ATP-binding protein
MRRNGKLYFNEGRFQVKVIDAMTEKMSPHIGRETIFGIRPEDIHDKLFISEAPPENTVKATCEVIEPMGSEIYIHLNTGNTPMIAKVGGRNRVTLNQDMDLVFDMSKAHFFDKDTDETIV